MSDIEKKNRTITDVMAGIKAENREAEGSGYDETELPEDDGSEYDENFEDETVPEEAEADYDSEMMPEETGAAYDTGITPEESSDGNTSEKKSGKGSGKTSGKEKASKRTYRDPELDRVYREGYADGTSAGRKSGMKENRRLKVQINRLRLLAAALLLTMILFAVLFFRECFRDRTYGRPVEAAAVLDDSVKLAGPEGMNERFTETYVKYLNKAYVMFGTYPDCSYYKVVAGIPRDDYDFENDFYTPEGESYKNYYPGGVKSGRVAIDVSTYQQDIDWEQVKASGVDVAIVRSGFRGYGEEGTLNEDSQFKNHIEGALEAGLDCGVYFFTEAVNYDEGVEEAKYVLDQIRPYHLTQPIVVDTEKISAEGVRANDISNEARTDALVGFCETIKAAGYTPMIYASTAWFCQAMDLSRLGEYEWWLAAYGTPQFPYHVEGWQYDPEGSVPGISGDVDLNVWLR